MVLPPSLLVVILIFLLFVYTGSALLLLVAIFVVFAEAAKLIQRLLHLPNSDSDSDSDSDHDLDDHSSIDLDLEASIPLPTSRRRRLHGAAAVIHAFAADDPSFTAYLQHLLLQSSTLSFVYEQDFQTKLQAQVASLGISMDVHIEQECVICLSDFEEQEKLRILPDCKHCFHADCIETWLFTSNFTCPLCRRPIEPKFTQQQQRSMAAMEPTVDVDVAAVNANPAPEHHHIDMNRSIDC